MKKAAGAKKSRSKPVPQIDPLLEGMMDRLLERLTALERKMDVVVSAISSRPSAGSDIRAHQEQNLQAKERVARRERIMFEAICADCNSPCEVPFRPTEGRAIYCKECWAQRRSGGGSDRAHAPSSGPNPNSFARPAGSAPVQATASAAPASAGVADRKAKAKTKAPAKKSKKSR